MGRELEVPKMERGIDRAKVQEESRAIAKDMWSGKLTVNEQRALNHICKLYDLDPLLKQIVCLGNNLYFTSGGLKVLANKDPKTAPNGIEVTPATPEERKNANVPEKAHYWKAIVWKKGCEKAFIEFGEADEGNVNLHKAGWKGYQDMAKTRAVNRALRNAYAISLTSVEETDYATNTDVITVESKEVKEETTHQPPEAPTQSPKKQTSIDISIHNLKKELNKLTGNDRAYYNLLGAEFGVGHMTELDKTKRIEFANKIVQELKTLK